MPRRKTAAEFLADFNAATEDAGMCSPHVDTPCRVWTGRKRTLGLPYGVVWFRDKDWMTHRVAYTLFVAEIPEGMFVLHRCDNPPCVNPNHLFLGDHQANCDDKMHKGRQNPARGDRHSSRTKPGSVPRGDAHHARRTPEVMARGERHGTHTHPEKVTRGEKHLSAKLTEQQVRDIRARFAAGERRSDLAAEYGTSWPAMDALVNRRTWKHI